MKEEIGGYLFSILIDESHDMLVKKQMAVVVRFVNKKGEVIERFWVSSMSRTQHQNH
jgi:hypothetical protein